MRVEDVNFRTILWTYEPLNNGEFAIQLRVTYYKDVKYFGLGFSCSKEDWDNGSESLKTSHPNFSKIQSKAVDLAEDIKFEIRLAVKEGKDTITLSEIKKLIKEKKKPVKTTAPSKVKLFEYFDEIIAKLEKQDRVGYADMFTYCKANLQKVFKTDKPFEAFTEADFEKYEEYLLLNVPGESTKSTYLRTFYNVWNRATKAGICKKDFHPKNVINFPAYKRIKTKKRAINSDYIKDIEALEYEPTSRLYRSQQFFMFSYYSRGLNFTDLALLKHEANIEGEYIDFKRAKNKRHYNFKLHPKAFHILQIFKEYPLQSDAGYIFPILHKHHDTARKIDQRIESALKDLNEDLKEMGKKVNAPKKLTSYVARHSFATNLRTKDVDVKIIQEALGHETELQTATYLAEIDDTIVASSIENAL